MLNEGRRMPVGEEVEVTFRRGDELFKTSLTFQKGGAAKEEMQRVAPLAEQGDTRAQVWMAEILCYDAGVQDVAQALQWCRKAAEQHDPEGEMLLGQMYREGNGAAGDPAAAFSWYSKAATQGVVTAEYWVGSMYHEGVGVKKDPAKAIEWLKKSADQGYELAQVTWVPCTPTVLASHRI